MSETILSSGTVGCGGQAATERLQAEPWAGHLGQSSLWVPGTASGARMTDCHCHQT